MDLLSGLALGVEMAITWEGLLFCLIGVSIGMFIGVLPGIGPLAAVAMTLPITYHLQPMSALIMLAGIFPGHTRRGQTPSHDAPTPWSASSTPLVVVAPFQERRALGPGRDRGIAHEGSTFAHYNKFKVSDSASFPNISELQVASTASSRRRTASTSSTLPHETS